MHDALETTFDRWCRRQAKGKGLRVGLIAWPDAGPTVLSQNATPGLPTSLSLRKSHVFADRYVPGVLEESRLIVPIRLIKANDPADTPTDTFGEGSAVWRSPDGDHPLSIEDLAMLVVLSVRQAFHNARGRAIDDPGFALLTGWMMTALDADDGALIQKMRQIEPRVFWWWGWVLQHIGEMHAAERAWMWQVENHQGPPDAAVRSLLELMESAKSSPADRLGLCRRAQRVFDETGFREFDLQTKLDLARCAALVDLGYRVEALESLQEVDRRLVANPCGGALRQTAKVAWLGWRAGGTLQTLGVTTALASGVVTSATARFKLRRAWSLRRLRSRRPRLPQHAVVPGLADGVDDSASEKVGAAIKRIALVRLDKIGDLVSMQPIIARVRERFPEAQIDLFVTAGLEPLAETLAEGVRPVGVSWKESEAFDKFLNQIESESKYDLLIDLLEPEARRHARLTRAIPAAYKVGFDSPGRGETFTHRVPTPAKPTHLIDRTAWLLRPLGISVPDEVGGRPALSLTPEVIESARVRLRECFGSSRVVGLHVGAGWRFKRWYPESFIEVGRALVEKQGVKIAVMAGPGEESLAAEVVGGLGDDAALFEPTLEQLPGLCAACDLMVVNDSGPMHVAVATGVPTVVAWGPGDRTLFEPRGADGQVRVVSDQPRCANCPQEVEAERCPMGYRYDAVPCLRNIALDQVVAASDELLASGANASVTVAGEAVGVNGRT
ncbi:MAG: glycosyltransferase family 9 protein [Planctomycetota bacterium]